MAPLTPFSECLTAQRAYLMASRVSSKAASLPSLEINQQVKATTSDSSSVCDSKYYMSSIVRSLPVRS